MYQQAHQADFLWEGLMDSRELRKELARIREEIREYRSYGWIEDITQTLKRIERELYKLEQDLS